MPNHKRRKAAPRTEPTEISWDRVWPRSEQLEFLDEMCQLHLEACTASPQSHGVAKLLKIAIIMVCAGTTCLTDEMRTQLISSISDRP